MASEVVVMKDFNDWMVVELKEYLRDRGISSDVNKAELVKLARLADQHNLEVDPDYLRDNISDEIRKKLTISGNIIPHPDRLVGSSDFSKLAEIDNIDMYNYLINFRQLYSHRQLKDITNIDGYQLYIAGYVQEMQFVVWTCAIQIVKFQVISS